jgi:hypothetical protein
MKWTWTDELIEVFKELGGVADYVQIESAVKRRNKKSNCSG